MTAIASHICPTCGERKPSTPEYFERDRRTRYGFLPGCKVCRWFAKRERARVAMRRYAPGYRAANGERLRARDRAYMRAYRMTGKVGI